MFEPNYVDIITQSNQELRMSSPGSHLPVSKMADGRRFADSFYFNCRRICDFSRLKAKDKSKVRKARAHRSFASFNASNEDLPTHEDDASLDGMPVVSPTVSSQTSDSSQTSYITRTLYCVQG